MSKKLTYSDDYAAALQVIDEYCKSDDHWTITKLQEFCRKQISKKLSKSQTEVKKLQKEIKGFKNLHTRDTSYDPWMTHFHD